MAIRTGTQLKSDMTTALASLNACITAATDVNITTLAIGSLQTLKTNALDTAAAGGCVPATSNGSRSVAYEIALLARSAIRELNHILASMANEQPAGLPPSARGRAVQRVRRSLLNGLFQAGYIDRATTD